MNPLTADRKFPSNEYTELVGFYAVSPLGQ